MTIIPPRGPAASLDPAVSQLVRRIARMEAEIAQLKRSQRASQLAYSSVENGTIQFNDGNGVPQMYLGLQNDGTHALVAATGSDMAATSPPLISSTVNGLSATWDGFMFDGSLPLSDFAAVQVYVDVTPGFVPSATNLQGQLTQAGQLQVSGLDTSTVYYTAFVAVNQAQQPGPPTYGSPTIPDSVVGSIPPGSVTGGANGLIASATVDSTNLIAGLVVAGIVDGSLIQGAQVVIEGTNGELLVYNGLPMPGDLLLSISATAGTDAQGNAYVPGVITYDNNYRTSVCIAQGWNNGLQYFGTAATQAGPYVAASGTLRSIGSYQNGFTSGLDCDGVNKYPVTVTQLDANTITMAGRVVTPAGWTSGMIMGALGAPFVLPPPGSNPPEFTSTNSTGNATGSIVLRPNGNICLFSGQWGAGYNIICAGTFNF